MVCQTIKVGNECGFMTKKGCGFNGGSCHVVVENCAGCSKIIDLSAGQYCMIYPNPSSKWIVGKCPTATHIKREIAETTQKINPLKASKRANKH